MLLGLKLNKYNNLSLGKRKSSSFWLNYDDEFLLPQTQQSLRHIRASFNQNSVKSDFDF